MKLKNSALTLFTAMCALSVCACSSGNGGDTQPNSADTAQTEAQSPSTDCIAPPSQTAPTDCTCSENLAYIVGKFAAQAQYHSYTYGTTTAAIATQVSQTWKDFKDGVLITSDVTYSALVKGSNQSCTVSSDKEQSVYFRKGSTPQKNSTYKTVEWNTDEPEYYSENDYMYTYGLLPTELFNYIVSADTLISCSELETNSDGTYTQQFSLDTDKSTVYYKYGMKTRGGLSAYPKYQTVNLTVTFDESWQILSTTVHEVAKVCKGIWVTSTSDFTTEYYYGEEAFDNDHFSAYESYYKEYI